MMHSSTDDVAAWALTEKEKQTLRLIVRGHDAKSIARRLDLSVHTINERLRDARRKMAVSSSREAARLLLNAEDGERRSPDPELFGDVRIGGDTRRGGVDRGAAPDRGADRDNRGRWITIGAVTMTLTLALLIFGTSPPATTTLPQTPATSRPAPDAEVVASAERWLTLLDQNRWDESYRLTGSSFRKLNTAKVWAAASEKVRVPLGAMLSRTLVSQEELPAPPHGYQVVKFRTAYANRAEAIETVTLDREDGAWRVVGVYVV